MNSPSPRRVPSPSSPRRRPSGEGAGEGLGDSLNSPSPRPVPSPGPPKRRPSREGTGRGLGEFVEAHACPFPAPSPLPLAGRRGPAEGSEEAPRVSACSPVQVLAPAPRAAPRADLCAERSREPLRPRTVTGANSIFLSAGLPCSPRQRDLTAESPCGGMGKSSGEVANSPGASRRGEWGECTGPNYLYGAVIEKSPSSREGSPTFGACLPGALGHRRGGSDVHGALLPVGAEGAGRSGGGLGELAEALACPFPAQSPLRLAGRRDRPSARRIHRVAEALPCSDSASESGAKGPAEGSASSTRLSPAPSLLSLRFD